MKTLFDKIYVRERILSYKVNQARADHIFKNNSDVD